MFNIVSFHFSSLSLSHTHSLTHTHSSLLSMPNFVSYVVDILLNKISIVLTTADMIGLQFESEEIDRNSELNQEFENENENKIENSTLKCNKIDVVWRAIWAHLCCYLIPIDDYTRWFLMDEVSWYRVTSQLRGLSLSILLLLIATNLINQNKSK